MSNKNINITAKKRKDVKQIKNKTVKPPKTKQEKPKKLPKEKVKKQVVITEDMKSNLFFKTIEKELRNQIQSCEIGIYELDDKLSVSKTIAGQPLSDINVERYASLSETTVLINPCGIYDEPKYLNRLITQLSHQNKKYLLTVSSYAFEALSRKGQQEKVLKIIGLKKECELI